MVHRYQHLVAAGHHPANAVSRGPSRGWHPLTIVTWNESFLTILPETLEVFAAGKRLISAHEVRGVQVHDARLAANMRVHGVSNLLTLNGADFRRFPDILPVKPADLA